MVASWANVKVAYLAFATDVMKASESAELMAE